jgi:hypothetical protein
VICGLAGKLSQSLADRILVGDPQEAGQVDETEYNRRGEERAVGCMEHDSPGYD